MGIGENVGCWTGSNTGSSGDPGIGIVPVITSIFTHDLTNELTVNLNTGVQITEGSGLDFTDGMSVTVDGTPIGILSDGTTNNGNGILLLRMTYNFAEGELVELTYTESLGAIESIIGTISLADQTIDYNIPVQGEGWTIRANFETGNVGDVAQRIPDAFHTTASRSLIANSPVLNGSQSASCTIDEGSTGGGWGGSFNYPQVLREGDSVWWRMNYYYPAGFDFSCGCTEGTKHMRIHVSRENASNVGYLGNLVMGGSTGGYIVCASEVAAAGEFTANNYTSGNYDKFTNGEVIPRDTWMTVEFQVKFGLAGFGEYRCWQDGILILEDLQSRTLSASTDYSDFVYLLNYWNNGAPRTQTLYVDDIILTSETPSNTDANGNPYIGVGPYP